MGDGKDQPASGPCTQRWFIQALQDKIRSLLQLLHILLSILAFFL